MKRFELKKRHISERAFLSKLRTSFKRALGMIGAESSLASSLQATMKEPEETYLNYDALRRINAQMLKIERQKAEAMQLYIRERYRCI